MIVSRFGIVFLKITNDEVHLKGRRFESDSFHVTNLSVNDSTLMKDITDPSVSDLVFFNYVVVTVDNNVNVRNPGNKKD